MDFTVQREPYTLSTTETCPMMRWVLGLLICNFFMGALAFYGALHQKIVVTPFWGKAEYQNSFISMDKTYLLMMTENLIYARLNFTPETMRHNHKRLLSLIDIQYYPAFSAILNKEARKASSQKIASYFEIKQIQCDERKRQCTVNGKLKQAIKSRAFRETPASYVLQYRYHLGRLSLVQFEEMKVDTAS